VKATLKGLQTLQENLDGHEVPVPTPQGYIRWERELDAVIKIIAMPDGKDPDEVIQSNPDEWRALVTGAKPAMDFYITALTSDLDLRSGKGKAEAVARLAPLLAQIANPVEQAHHIQQIARLIQVEEQIIRQTLPRPERQSRRPAPAVPNSASASQEDHMLGWLLRYPAARTAVQEKIRRDLLPFPFVGEIIQGTLLELFERIENRALWEAWQEQPPGTNALEWVETLSEPLREQAERVLELDIPHPQAYRYVNDVQECARMLQAKLAHRWKDRITQDVNAATDEAEWQEKQLQLVEIKSYIDALNIPKRSSAYNKDLHNLHAV